MTAPAPGKLVGIARRAASRAPMEELEHVLITRERGLDGDHRGAKSPTRRVTVIAREAWEAALADLGGPGDLPWTTRRANLLVEGITLPRVRGGLVRVGPVLLEVTTMTHPCERMEEAYPGLEEALRPDGRGGVCCQVLEGGIVIIGDFVTVGLTPPEQPEAPGGVT